MNQTSDPYTGPVTSGNNKTVCIWSVPCFILSTGPDGWSKSYPMCGGQFQSPIDIEVSQVTFDPLLTDFNYINYENTVLSDFELINTGASSE